MDLLYCGRESERLGDYCEPHWWDPSSGTMRAPFIGQGSTFSKAEELLQPASTHSPAPPRSSVWGCVASTHIYPPSVSEHFKVNCRSEASPLKYWSMHVLILIPLLFTFFSDVNCTCAWCLHSYRYRAEVKRHGVRVCVTLVVFFNVVISDCLLASEG